MYVMVLPEGYLQIEVNTEGVEIDGIEYIPATYSINTYEGENAVTVDLPTTPNVTTQPIEIMPLGQIVVNQFNEQWRQYKDAGGNLTEAPGPHQLILDDPCGVVPPHLPSGNLPDDNERLSDIDFAELRYIQVSYVPLAGRTTSVIKVNTLPDLYWYDLEQIATKKIKIRQCKACGLAFVAAGKTLYCKACKNEGAPNRMKHTSLVNDAVRHTRHEIIQRNTPPRRACIDKNAITYGLGSYCARLRRVTEAHKDHDTPEQLAAYIRELDELDMRYFKLCKFMENGEITEELYDKWCNEKAQFPEVGNMRRWIEKWEKKLP